MFCCNCRQIVVKLLSRVQLNREAGVTNTHNRGMVQQISFPLSEDIRQSVDTSMTAHVCCCLTYLSYSAQSYAYNATRSASILLKSKGTGLKSTSKTSFPTTLNCSETDISTEGYHERAFLSSHFVGVLQLAVGFGWLGRKLKPILGATPWCSSHQSFGGIISWKMVD